MILNPDSALPAAIEAGARLCCSCRLVAASRPLPATTCEAIDDLIEGVISDVAARHATADARNDRQTGGPRS